MLQAKLPVAYSQDHLSSTNSFAEPLLFVWWQENPYHQTLLVNMVYVWIVACRLVIEWFGKSLQINNSSSVDPSISGHIATICSAHFFYCRLWVSNIGHFVTSTDVEENQVWSLWYITTANSKQQPEELKLWGSAERLTRLTSTLELETQEVLGEWM